MLIRYFVCLFVVCCLFVRVFVGLTSQDEATVFKTCVGDAMGFLQLIVQYCGKDEAIVNGINYVDKTTGHSPLTYYITSKRANKKGLRLLLSFDKLDIKKVKYNNKNVLQLATEAKRQDLASLLQPYFEVKVKVKQEDKKESSTTTTKQEPPKKK